MTLSRDSRFLYVKNTLLGTVTGFRVDGEGSLIQIDQEEDDSLVGSIGLAGL
jgi:6-phosphogluconolactonase (cycloisomerase 2 family)